MRVRGRARGGGGAEVGGFAGRTESAARAREERKRSHHGARALEFVGGHERLVVRRLARALRGGDRAGRVADLRRLRLELEHVEVRRRRAPPRARVRARAGGARARGRWPRAAFSRAIVGPLGSPNDVVVFCARRATIAREQAHSHRARFARGEERKRLRKESARAMPRARASASRRRSSSMRACRRAAASAAAAAASTSAASAAAITSAAASARAASSAAAAARLHLGLARGGRGGRGRGRRLALARLRSGDGACRCRSRSTRRPRARRRRARAPMAPRAPSAASAPPSPSTRSGACRSRRSRAARRAPGRARSLARRARRARARALSRAARARSPRRPPPSPTPRPPSPSPCRRSRGPSRAPSPSSPPCGGGESPRLGAEHAIARRERIKIQQTLDTRQGLRAWAQRNARSALGERRGACARLLGIACWRGRRRAATASRCVSRKSDRSAHPCCARHRRTPARRAPLGDASTVAPEVIMPKTGFRGPMGVQPIEVACSRH